LCVTLVIYQESLRNNVAEPKVRQKVLLIKLEPYHYRLLLQSVQ